MGEGKKSEMFSFCSALGYGLLNGCVSSVALTPTGTPFLPGPIPPGSLHCGSGSSWMNPVLDSIGYISHCFFNLSNDNGFLLLLCSGHLAVPLVLSVLISLVQ